MRSVLIGLLLTASAPAAAQSVAVATTSGGAGRSSITVTVPFGQAARINRESFRPVAIIEDSRCPTRVTCVWRGRLVVEFAHGRSHRIRLEDGKPLGISGGRLTLVGATPRSQRGETIPPQSYRFQLRFERP